MNQQELQRPIPLCLSSGQVTLRRLHARIVQMEMYLQRDHFFQGIGILEAEGAYPVSVDHNR